MQNRNKIVAVSLVLASAALIGAIAVICKLEDNQTLNAVVESGDYSVVVADAVDIKSDFPPSSSVIKLNTLVIRNPRIVESQLGPAWRKTIPNGSCVLVASGPYLSSQMRVAIWSQSKAAGIPYVIETTNVTIYTLTSGDKLANGNPVRTTHLLLK